MHRDARDEFLFGHEEAEVLTPKNPLEAEAHILQKPLQTPTKKTIPALKPGRAPTRPPNNKKRAPCARLTVPSSHPRKKEKHRPAARFLPIPAALGRRPSWAPSALRTWAWHPSQPRLADSPRLVEAPRGHSNRDVGHVNSCCRLRNPFFATK